MTVDGEQRCTLTFEDKRGNVLVADMHCDRVSVLVGAAGKNPDDPTMVGWVHLTVEEGWLLAAQIREFILEHGEV